MLLRTVAALGGRGASDCRASGSAGARMKEALQQVNERWTGNRFLRGLVTPGGVHFDLTDELIPSIQRVVERTLGSLHCAR